MAFFQSAVGTLQTFVIALRRNGRMSLTRPAAGGGIPQAGFHLHGQNAQHFVPYSTRDLVEHKTSVMWNNG